MKIENLRLENNGKRTKVVATVVWEDCDQPNQDIYIETEQEFAQDLSCNPNAFLVASTIPALHFGEKRVFIDAEICPELREGLKVAMNWLSLWYYGFNNLIPVIEGKTHSRPTNPTKVERAGMFLSGGIDSLGIVRENRLNFPLEHPRAFKDGLTLNTGMSAECFLKGWKDQFGIFQERLISFSDIARDANLTLIPVYTNIRYMGLDDDFFEYQFQGAILAAVAHAFSGRLTSVSIAASDSIPGMAVARKENLRPWGSHPLLDQNYSSSNLRILHDGLTLSRLERTELVANWNEALQNVQVCPREWPGKNCGKCDKCVRTMLGLVVLEALERTHAFPKDDVSEEMVSKIKITNPFAKTDYSELITPLRVKGRYDLVRAIDKIIARYDHRMRYGEGGG